MRTRYEFRIRDAQMCSVQDNYRVNVYKVKRGSVNEYINSMIRRRRRENLRA